MWPPRAPQHPIRVCPYQSLDHGYEIRIVGTLLGEAVGLRELNVRLSRFYQRQHRIEARLRYAAFNPPKGVENDRHRGRRELRFHGSDHVWWCRDLQVPSVFFCEIDLGLSTLCYA